MNHPNEDLSHSPNPLRILLCVLSLFVPVVQGPYKSPLPAPITPLQVICYSLLATGEPQTFKIEGFKGSETRITEVEPSQASNSPRETLAVLGHLFQISARDTRRRAAAVLSWPIEITSESVDRGG